jgi:hypothetical protein
VFEDPRMTEDTAYLHDGLRTLLNIDFDQAIPKKTLHYMILTAKLLASVPAYKNCTLSEAKAFQRLHNPLKAFVAYEQCKNGDNKNVVALTVDLLLNEDRSKLHSAVALEAAIKMVQALGCKDILDDQTNIDADTLNSEEVDTVLKQCNILGLGRRGKDNGAKVSSLLTATVGLKLHYYKEDDMYSLKFESMFVNFWLQSQFGMGHMEVCSSGEEPTPPHQILCDDWFEKKWKTPIPTLDQYKPKITDSIERMTEIVTVFHDSKDPELVQLRAKLITELQRRSLKPCSHCGEMVNLKSLDYLIYESCAVCVSEVARNASMQPCWKCESLVDTSFHFHSSSYHCCAECLPTTAKCTCNNPMAPDDAACRYCTRSLKRQLEDDERCAAEQAHTAAVAKERKDQRDRLRSKHGVSSGTKMSAEEIRTLRKWDDDDDDDAYERKSAQLKRKADALEKSFKDNLKKLRAKHGVSNGVKLTAKQYRSPQECDDEAYDRQVAQLKRKADAVENSYKVRRRALRAKHGVKGYIYR